MANYAVTDYVVYGSAEFIAAAMETKLETIDDTKTIIHLSVNKSGNEFVGILIYEA